MAIRFCILGPLRVVHDDRELALGRRQQRALLARLLLEPGRAVPVDRLVDDLWGDDAPPSARGSLQALVSRLRSVLEPGRSSADPAGMLVHRAPGYALDVPSASIDATRFDRLAGEGRRLLGDGRPGEALERLDDALALWRGDVLADLADDAFVVPFATRLHGLRTDAREHRATALLATGAAASAIAELEALTAEDELRERPWELLLQALHATGRTAEALERYRTLRDRFRDELGLDPGAGLRQVESALLQGTPTLGAVRRAVLRPADDPRPDAAVPAEPSPSDAVPPAPIGRDAEWDLLAGALARGSAGASAWAVVVGDPGIGKTTLVQHLASTAEAGGVRVRFGRCHEADVTPAFWPWVQILRSIDDLVPGAAPLLDDPGSVRGDATQRLFSLFDRVETTLRTAAERTPLLVVLEDVHWADEESLQLVQFLAVQLRGVRVTFALTARRGEGSVELRRTLADLARHPEHVRLELGGLDTDATASLIRSVTGHVVDPVLAARVQERTGGNPFFATELARLGEPALVGEAVPDTVREVLARRIARLPETASDLLTLAAVHGAEFGLDALVASSDSPESAVVDHLDLALAARLVVTTDDPLRFRFAHALVRDAALDRLSDLQRRRAHLRIARSLQGLARGDVTAWASEVAHHLLAAAPLGDPSDALEAARTAAVIADSRLAFHEAARWWAGALRVLDWDRSRSSDRRLRFDLLCALGAALGDAGEWSTAIERLAEAIDVAADLGDPAAMAEAATAFEGTAGLWPWVAYDTRPVELLARLDRVLAAIETVDPERYIEVLAIRAVGEYYGDVPLGQRLADEALRRARSLERPRLVLTALLAKLRISYSHDDLEGQLACSAEMLELATREGLLYEQLLAWTYRMANLTMAGDLAGAEEAFRRAEELSSRLGLVIFQAQLGWTASVFPLIRGDLVEAELLIEEADAFHARTRLYARDHAYAWARTVLLWDQDRLEELDAASLRCVPEARIALRFRAGDVTGARQMLHQRCSRARDASYDVVGFLQLRARLVVELGVRELAPALIAALAPHADRHGVCGTIACVGPVPIELAQLHALLGDLDTATAMLDASIARAEAAGWRTWADRGRRARATLGVTAADTSSLSTAVDAGTAS